MRQKRFGWTVRGILGAIFLPLGLIFLALGVLLWRFGAGTGPDDPQIFLYAFGGEGLVFAVAGACLLCLDMRRRARLRDAYEGGHCVMADITGVVEQRHVRVNGRHPFVVECRYTDPSTGDVHIYHSRYLYVDVTDLLRSAQVPVYTDRRSFDTGFVDIDAVLPAIKTHS
ncbi:MAG: hypothetical protein E7317_01695 [Clostridiales bacterium]|nr:hypothetical protein [Clostridiales bacterium]